jgi:hypothetical protein
MGVENPRKKLTGSPKMGVVCGFSRYHYPQNGGRIALYYPQYGGAKKHKEFYA